MKADFGRTQQYRAYSAPAVIDPVSASTIAEFILTSRKALYDSAADQLLIHGAALMQALPRMIRYLAVYARTAPQEQDGFVEWCATARQLRQGLGAVAPQQLPRENGARVSGNHSGHALSSASHIRAITAGHYAHAPVVPMVTDTPVMFAEVSLALRRRHSLRQMHTVALVGPVPVVGLPWRPPR
jgi:hypothetical protein